MKNVGFKILDSHWMKEREFHNFLLGTFMGHNGPK